MTKFTINTIFNKFFLGAPCIDDLKWVDTKYGDGKSRCPDMTKEWCQNHGDYSLEAKRACPNTCGACQGICIFFD